MLEFDFIAEGVMKAATQTSNQPILWGRSLGHWDGLGVKLMFAGAITGVLALAISLVSSFILWRVAGVAQSELIGRVADARKAGIAAGEAAGHAQAAADAAQVEIAKQKTLTAQAQLETERIKKEVAWRELTPAQARLLQKKLSDEPMSLTIDWVDNPEANELANQLAHIFSRAGLAWKQGSSSLAGDSTTGLRVTGRKREAQKLNSALSGVGLQTTLAISDQDLHLKIGLKPRPRLDN